jgi:DNA topoisomerase-1
MKLMIIGSKGKLEKLAAILGNEWKVAASLIHVRDLPTNEMDVSEPNFTPIYKITEHGKLLIFK